MLVQEGDLVKQGQPIATVGSTGNAGWPQVHFELRKGKEPVDPSVHLPPLQG
jgi:murein DD-endopeptidase MepM/ murein hydrolase activator NlpD